VTILEDIARKNHDDEGGGSWRKIFCRLNDVGKPTARFTVKKKGRIPKEKGLISRMPPAKHAKKIQVGILRK